MYNASKLAYKHGKESVGKKQGLDVRSARDYVTPGAATPGRRNVESTLRPEAGKCS